MFVILLSRRSWNMHTYTERQRNIKNPYKSSLEMLISKRLQVKWKCLESECTERLHEYLRRNVFMFSCTRYLGCKVRCKIKQAKLDCTYNGECYQRSGNDADDFNSPIITHGQFTMLQAVYYRLVSLRPLTADSMTTNECHRISLK